MARAHLILAAIDNGVAIIIAAIFTAFAAAVARMAPKTRPEAALDRAQARLHEAEAWQALVDQHRKDAEMWKADVETLRRELEERDQRIDGLEKEIKRLRILIDRA